MKEIENSHPYINNTCIFLIAYFTFTKKAHLYENIALECKHLHVMALNYKKQLTSGVIKTVLAKVD